MSSDNGLLVDRKTFEVMEWQGDGKPWLLKKCKTLEEALDYAKKYCSDEIVEYGISLR